MKSLLLSISFIFCFLFSDAQNVFEKKFTSAQGGCQDVISMCSTSDEGYAILENSFFNSKGLIIRSDSSGNLLWKKQYSSAVFYDIVLTHDHGFAVCGVINSFTPNYPPKIFVMKADSAGNVLWAKIMGNLDDGYSAFSIKETNSNNLILFGLDDGAQHLCFLACIDSSGNQLWSHSYSNLVLCWQVGEVISCSDRGFLFTQSIRDSITNMSSLIYVVKTDSLGNIQWGRLVSTDTSTQGADAGMAARETPDNGFLIAGSTFDQNLLLIRFDSSGHVSWTKKHVFGFPISAVSLDTARDHGFILTLNSSQQPNGGFLVSADSLGNIQWAKKYGTPDTQLKKVICLPGNLGFAVCGIMDTGASHTIYFARTDTAGITGCDQSVSYTSSNIVKTIDTLEVMYPGMPDSAITVQVSNISVTAQTVCVNGINQFSTEENLAVFPNPASDRITFQTENSIAEIIISDQLGREIRRQKLNGEKQTEISVADLADGMYFYQVVTKDNIRSGGKFIVQH